MTQLKNKEDRQNRRLYLKTNKKYKKELKKLFKQVAPWDNFIGMFFDIQVRWWKDYYKLGYNVWGMETKDTPEFEEPNRPTRYEIACEMERLYKEWQDFSGMDVVKLEDGEWEVKYHERYLLPDGKVNIDLLNQDNRDLEKNFFDYYIKYCHDMWD